MVGTMNKFTDWIAKEKGITAPSAAPAETPKIEGSANGFLNRPCITAPDIDNARPTKNDSKILGSLISRIIELYISLSIDFRKNKEIISDVGISITPDDKDKIAIKKDKEILNIR